MRTQKIYTKQTIKVGREKKEVYSLNYSSYRYNRAIVSENFSSRTLRDERINELKQMGYTEKSN